MTQTATPIKKIRKPNVTKAPFRLTGGVIYSYTILQRNRGNIFLALVKMDHNGKLLTGILDCNADDNIEIGQAVELTRDMDDKGGVFFEPLCNPVNSILKVETVAQHAA